ncbi:MAG: cob(I)yrinic acid a,c-diamide adenosyltransferase [Planctomycetota bacterium]|nr:cob(I)yrinic acid a,c-diamide adenosyltransferase [Planctomycetota bacterium]
MNDQPRILVFTGEGKGKTTAALGMALRAAGHGMRVHIIQFVKADPRTGEINALSHLPGVTLVQAGRGFLPPATDPKFAAHQAAARDGLAQARQALAAGDIELLILDELCLAVSAGLVAEAQVLELIAGSGRASLVLTGRGATPGLIAAADTVTEMRPVKHLFDTNRGSAAKGVEF